VKFLGRRNGCWCVVLSMLHDVLSVCLNGRRMIGVSWGGT